MFQLASLNVMTRRVSLRIVRKILARKSQDAVAKNPELSNVRGTKKQKWGIAGVIRGGKGKCPKPAKLVRQTMGL